MCVACMCVSDQCSHEQQMAHWSLWPLGFTPANLSFLASDLGESAQGHILPIMRPCMCLPSNPPDSSFLTSQHPHPHPTAPGPCVRNITLNSQKFSEQTANHQGPSLPRKAFFYSGTLKQNGKTRSNRFSVYHVCFPLMCFEEKFQWSSQKTKKLVVEQLIISKKIGICRCFNGTA